MTLVTCDWPDTSDRPGISLCPFGLFQHSISQVNKQGRVGLSPAHPNAAYDISRKASYCIRVRSRKQLSVGD